MKNYLLVPMLCFALLSAGCAARQTAITNLPTGVTQSEVQNWDTAVKNLDIIAQSVSTARQTIVPLCTPSAANPTPVIPQSYCKVILTDIGKIASAEFSADQLLEQTPSNWGTSTANQVGQYISQITTLLFDLTNNGVVGIKDAVTAQSIDALLNTIRASAVIIQAL